MDNLPYETRMSLAIDALNSSLKPNYAKVAHNHKLKPHALSRRYQGKTVSRTAANSKYRQCLTNAQEDVLVSYIQWLTNRSLSPTSQIVKNLAEEMIGREVGKNWVSGFVNRRKEVLCSHYLRNMDNSRVKAAYTPMIDYFFQILTETLEKYYITGENIYNMDEKGFLLGLAHAVKHIMSREAYKSGRVKHARQDGSREFLTLLAFICADSTAGDPFLIYQGKSNNLQDTWMDDLNIIDNAYFSISPNGWSSHEIGLKWLIEVFDPATREKAGHRRRLLILDGHSSHVNMAFITACDDLGIILLVFPPHATQWMQPLDVSIFGPLATAYSNLIQKLMSESEGLASMSKKHFWRIFREAWATGVTAENISSAFDKTGIWPTKASKVVDILKLPTHTLPKKPHGEVANTLKTPKDARQLRAVFKHHDPYESRDALDKVIKSLETAFAEVSIKQHRIEGLTTTIKDIKGKSRNNKRLNLKGDEVGGPSIWSAKEVMEAKEYQAKKLENEETLKVEKAAIKIANQRKAAKKKEDAV